jgi:hypothetical protein
MQTSSAGNFAIYELASGAVAAEGLVDPPRAAKVDIVISVVDSFDFHVFGHDTERRFLRYLTTAIPTRITDRKPRVNLVFAFLKRLTNCLGADERPSHKCVCVAMPHPVLGLEVSDDRHVPIEATLRDKNLPIRD